MHKKYKLIAIFGIIVTILLPQLTVIGQDIAPNSLDSNGLKTGELANCFDVYKFQSISVVASVKDSIYKPNDMVEISGTITNNNPYPVIGANIRAKILRTHPNPIERRAKYITVEDKVIHENLNLKANETYEFEYGYFVPSNAPSGEYIVQYYVYNQDRFNLAGLSFTEDVFGNKTMFTVEGESQHIYLDKSNITVNGKEHDTMGFLIQVPNNETAIVKLPLVNPDNFSKEMVVNYKLYRWDELLDTNFIEEKTEQVLVSANSKLDLQYEVNINKEPVYYLVVKAYALGEKETDALRTQTMAHIRFAVEENNRSRINWVGLNKYPIQKGEDVQLMTCVHNTSNGVDAGPIKVKSTVKDSKGKELTSIEYEGNMVPDINGLSNKFKADSNLNQITIETSLYNASNDLIDSVVTNYDCSQLNPDLCVTEANTLDNVYKYKNNIYYFLLSLIAIISLILGSKIIINKYKK